MTVRSLALVIADLGSGGAQRVVSTLATAWSERGQTVSVITLAGADDDFFRLPPSVRRVSIGGLGRGGGFAGGVTANLARVRSLRRALRRVGAEVAVGFITPTNVLLTLAALGTEILTVVSERNDPRRQSFGCVWDHLRRITYRFADVVTANSHGTLEALAAFVPRSKLAFVPNPLSVPQDGETPRRPIVLAVGRLHHQKGFDVLLDAFAEAALQGWRLAVVGDGGLRQPLMDQAAGLGISDRVDWMGRVDDPMPLYREASVFALPSRYEGTPNALLEAMASGCACIVSDASPGPLEYVRHGVSGIVTAAESVRDLAGALDRLAGDAELRSTLGQGARKAVAALDIDSVLAQWEAVIWPEKPR